MTDKEKLIYLQRELQQIKIKADLALWCCQTSELHSDKIGKTKDLILTTFYTVRNIPVDVQEHMEERFNCHLCIPDECTSDRFEDLPLPNGQHSCIAESYNGKILRDVQVHDGQANIIDIFQLTGQHTAGDPDHRFIEDICMRDKKTMHIHYGS